MIFLDFSFSVFKIPWLLPDWKISSHYQGFPVWVGTLLKIWEESPGNTGRKIWEAAMRSIGEPDYLFAVSSWSCMKTLRFGLFTVRCRTTYVSLRELMFRTRINETVNSNRQKDCHRIACLTKQNRLTFFRRNIRHSVLFFKTRCSP